MDSSNKALWDSSNNCSRVSWDNNSSKGLWGNYYSSRGLWDRSNASKVWQVSNKSSKVSWGNSKVSWGNSQCSKAFWDSSYSKGQWVKGPYSKA